MIWITFMEKRGESAEATESSWVSATLDDMDCPLECLNGYPCLGNLTNTSEKLIVDSLRFNPATMSSWLLVLWASSQPLARMTWPCSFDTEV